jgi:hypothetical protein
VVAETTPSRLGVLYLEENGLDPLTEHYFNVPAYSEASLLYAQGHLFAAYAEEPELDDLPNRIMALRLSCRR